MTFNLFRRWKYAYKYTLGEDKFYIVRMPGAQAFQNKWIEIIPLAEGLAQVRITAGYSWNGCSVVPDAPGTKDASGIHDPLYQFSKEIAKAWGVSVGVVIGLADDAFLEIMRRDKCPVAGLYYAGVRVFGRPFRFFSSLFSG
jgi:hypothetical protein